MSNVHKNFTAKKQSRLSIPRQFCQSPATWWFIVLCLNSATGWTDWNWLAGLNSANANPPPTLNFGSSLYIPSFSKTRSPWTVCSFGVIPEQGKKLTQNSLFHSSTAERAIISILVDLWAAQNVFLLLPYLLSHGPNGNLSLLICRCYAMFKSSI